MSVNFRTLRNDHVRKERKNVIASTQTHSRTQRFREHKHRRNDQSGPPNVMQASRGSF